MPKKGQYSSTATADSKRQRAYNESPLQKKRRAERNAARAKLTKQGRVHKGDGNDVNHKNMNTANNSNSNLNVESKSKNRAGNRHHLKGKK